MTEKGSYIVSWSCEHGEDRAVLIVGNQVENGKVDIVNAFAGKDAVDIYNLLSHAKKEK